MNYRQLIENNRVLLESLDEEYYNTAKDINFYLKSKLRTRFRTEIIMNDILSMFVDYQKRECIVEEVIGNDVKAFCDDILNSTEDITIKDRINQFFYSNVLMIIEIILLNFLFYGMESLKFENIFTYNVLFHFEVLIAFIPLQIILLAGRAMYRQYGTPKARKISIVVIGMALITLFIILFVFFRSERRWVLQINIIVLIILAIVSILLFLSSKKYINNEVDKHITYEF